MYRILTPCDRSVKCGSGGIEYDTFPTPLRQSIFWKPRDQLLPGSFPLKREEPGNEVDSIRGFPRSLYKYPLKELKPGTNWGTLLRKDIFHIYISLTIVSVCHIVLPASVNGERVFDQMFLNLIRNIFAFRETTLVFASKVNVSRYGRQGNI